MIPADIVTRARDRSIADVALALGAADAVKIDERGVPCPFCGGRDRFSIDKGKNVFLCRTSGAGGDPIALVQHVHQCSFAEAIEHLTGEKPLATAARRPAPSDDDKNAWREKARRRAWKIWQNGAPIDAARGGHWVRDYLALRAIPFPAWRIKALREMSNLAYWHRARAGDDFKVIHTGPAMLAAITGPDGHFIGVHRTWLDLTRPNGKAAIADPAGDDTLDAKKVEGSQKGGKIDLGIVALGRDNEKVGGFPVPAAPLSCGGTGGRDSEIIVADGRDVEATVEQRSSATICIVGEGIETVLSWAALAADRPPSIVRRPAGAPGGEAADAAREARLFVGINIGNIAGKAAEQIPHPSLMLTDRIGRQRRQKVGGHEPDLTDTDCLQIPADDFEKLILLGDSDSDRFTTQAAMLRARNRFELLGHDAEIDWAPDGQDFNDVLRGMAAQPRARAVA